MDQSIINAATTPIGMFGAFISCLFILLGLFSKRRNDDLRFLRDTNDDLRKSIDYKGTEIIQLRDEVRELSNQVVALQASNTTLQEIVNNALKEYFAENPGVVVQLSKTKSRA